MIRLKKILACMVVLLIAYSPLSNSAVMSLPGIPESGNPNFMNDARVNLFDIGNDNYLFAATNSGAPLTFNLGSNSVTSDAAHPAYFVLTALFSGDGSYIPNTGALSISGEIPFLFSNPKGGITSLPGVFISGDLLTAKLNNFAFDSDTLGFSTNQISGFGTFYSPAESVYLSATGLASALGFGSGSLIATTSPLDASAITTVPVPGAGWLIGSAFGLFTLLRKNRDNNEVAC